MALDYKAIDVDNHYYEPVDSFTRYLPKEFKRRGVQMVKDGKRTVGLTPILYSFMLTRRRKMARQLLFSL